MATSGNLTYDTSAWDGLTVTPSTAAQTVTLSTAQKYVDKNIVINVAAMSTGSASVTSDQSISVSGSGTPTYDSTNQNYKIAVSGSKTITGTVSKAGYISSVSSATVSASGNATVAAATTGTTNAGTLVSTIAPSTSEQYVNITAGYTPAKYWKISVPTEAVAKSILGTSDVTNGITTVDSSNNVTRGVHSATAGYTSGGTLAAATFANTATSNVSYVDLSATSAAPIISANGGYLYINQGYVDNLKISLAKLIPDSYTDGTNTYNIAGASADLRSGKNLFDKDGNVIIGSMADVSLKASTAAAVSGSNVTLSDTNNGISVTGSSTVTPTGSGYIASTASITPSKTRYITGITVPKDKTFTLTTTADTALDTSSNVTITNNAYRQLAITNNANGDVNISGAGQTDFTVGSTTTGTLNATAYIDNGTSTSSGSQAVITNGKWNYHSVTPSTSAQGPFYGETKVAAITASQARSIVGSGSVTPSFDSASLTCSEASIDTSAVSTASTSKITINTTHELTGTANATVVAGYIASSPTGVSVSKTLTGYFEMNAYDGAYTIA